MRNRLLAGIDIGGTKTAVILSRDPPHVLTRAVFPTLPAAGPAPAIAQIIHLLREALAAYGATPADLAGIGISCGGPLDSDRGLIQTPPNLPTWIDVPICTILAAEFGVPCALENDANAGALAELHFGAGRGVSNLIFLTMGTGLGAGLILNGALFRGASGNAGEIGHVRLTADGPVGYGKPGSVEGWASGGGMARIAAAEVAVALSRGDATALSSVSAPLTARDVASAVQQGDALALNIVRIVGEKLGEAVAILVDLFNPERIVVGGLALRFGDSLLNPAREAVHRESLAGSAAICTIVPAGLGEEIGDVAALCVAQQHLTPAGVSHLPDPQPEHLA